MADIIMCTACQTQQDNTQLVSTPEYSVSNTSSDQPPLEDTVNKDGTISLTNGDIVGPLYKQYYYDILSHNRFIYHIKTNNNDWYTAVYGDFFKIDVTHGQDHTNDYILLSNKSGNYWINKDQKTITKLISYDVDEIRNTLSNQIFSGLTFLKSYDKTIDNITYTIEEYRCNDSDENMLFYFTDNVLKKIEDYNHSLDVIEISSEITTDIFDTPTGYTEISEKQLVGQNSAEPSTETSPTDIIVQPKT